MKTEPVRVIYRADCVTGEIVAFLDGLACFGNVLCYQHVGQHGEASRAYYYACTRAATQEECAVLHEELTHVYSHYRLTIRRRLWRNTTGD